MPDGEMRRPPQLWEQRLARTTSLLGVGISSSGDNTAIVPPTPPPGSGGGTEPAPVLPAPDTFKTPSTPTLSGTVQGIRVSWDGRNSDGNAYPTGAYVEIHISTTGATFTPDATTLAGTLLGSAGFFTIGALTAGTTYFVRLVGVDEAGNRTSPSTAASGQTGLTTSSDYGTATITAGAVSFDARQIGGVTSTVGTAQPTSPVVGDIWLDTTGGATTHKRWNGTTWQTILFGSGSIADLAITTVKIDQAAITAAKLAGSAVTETKIATDAVTSPKIVAGAVVATKIAAGAVEADKIAANAVTADKIAANAITSDKIAANTITASDIAANTITASQIAASTITGTQIAAGAITAGAIAAGAVTTEKLNTGAVTADKIAASTITGDKIAANTIDATKINASFITASDVNGNVTSISASAITSGTITGRTLLSAGSGKRIVIDANVNELQFFNSNGTKTADLYPATIEGNDGLGITGALDVSSRITGQQLSINGANVDFPGVTTGTTDSDAGFNGDRLRKKTSSKRFKYDIAAVDGDFVDVEDAKRSEIITVNVNDVLDIGVAEFSWLEDGKPSDKRDLGFIAEDVAQKFPLATGRDPDGTPIAVRDTPILAALLAVVRQQQATITDLRSRVEALEA